MYTNITGEVTDNRCQMDLLPDTLPTKELSTLSPSDVSDVSERSEGFFFYFGFGSNLLAERIRINSPSAKLIGIGRLKNYHLGFCGWSDNWQGAVANIFPKDTVPEVPKINSYGPDLYNDLLVDKTVKENECIWGSVWEISLTDLPELDRQEGVHMKEYEPVMELVDLFEFFSTDPIYPKNFCSIEDTVSNDTHEVERLCELIKAFVLPPNEILSHSVFRSPMPLPLMKVYARCYRKVSESTVPDNVKLAYPSNSYKLVILKGALQSGLPFHYVQMLATLKTNGNQSIFTGWKK